MVIRDVVDDDGPERIEADDQLDVRDARACRDARLEHLRRQVQPCSGRGRRSRSIGVHGLIARRINESFRDVGRQRHLAVRLQRGEQISRLDAHDAPPVAEVLAHLDDEVVTERDPGARRKPATRPYERIPGSRTPLLEEEDLGRPARWPAESQPAGQHPCVVDDEHIAGAHEPGQIGGAVMGDGAVEVDQ